MADGVVVVRLSGDCPVCADAVPAKVRAGVTGADADACLQLLGCLASRLHTDRRAWPDAGN